MENQSHKNQNFSIWNRLTNFTFLVFLGLSQNSTSAYALPGSNHYFVLEYSKDNSRQLDYIDTIISSTTKYLMISTSEPNYSNET